VSVPCGSGLRLPAALLCAFAALLLSLAARADVVLTAGNLNSALKAMQRIHLRLADAAAEPSHADALFALGEEASDLALLMSREVAAHGQQQQGLLELARNRASALGVDIAWSSGHQRYFYDGAAFRRSLELAPDGRHAADSSFRILWHDFYHSAADDQAALLAAAARKQEFLRRFPDSGDAAEAGLMLGIDYRDLWRDCRDRGAGDCEGRYRELTRGQLGRVAEQHAGTDRAGIAARLLQRFEAELADPQSAAGEPPSR
jgi:hypothetical protein